MFRNEKLFMREKRITVGDTYMEVDLIPHNLADERSRAGKQRKRKENVTAPSQANLNDKNARRYLIELGNGNFDESDIYLTLTYDKWSLPKTVEEAEHNMTNYLRKLKRRRKKLGLDPLKYILVTEYVEDKDTGKFSVRMNHHLVINSGLDRDEIEKMWSKKDPETNKQRRMGRARAERVQYDDGSECNGIEGLMKYFSKDPKGKKRWSSSRNLKRPVMRKNDWKYRTSALLKAKESPDRGMSYFQKKYPDYEIVDRIEWEENEMTGWHCYLKMWKKSTERVM